MTTTTRLHDALSDLAPGSLVRDAIERVMHAGRGTLLVIGDDETVAAICSGGFEIGVVASAQRIAELAKMDGAIVLNGDATRILRANVHLMPDPTISTFETGTRHRTAERVARQTGLVTIAVSEATASITIYLDDQRRVLDDLTLLLARANQALATLERYRQRLDDQLDALTGHELEGTVTLRDVTGCLQRAEMLARIADEADSYVSVLGNEGRLVQLQIDEVHAGPDPRELLLSDYGPGGRDGFPDALEELSGLSDDQLLTHEAVASLLVEEPNRLEQPLAAAGWRLLSHVPRLPKKVAATLVDTFETVPSLAGADPTELAALEGVGHVRAARVRETLEQLSARR